MNKLIEALGMEGPRELLLRAWLWTDRALAWSLGVIVGGVFTYIAAKLSGC